MSSRDLPPLPPDAHAEPLGGGTQVWVSPRFGFGMDAVLLAHFALDCAPRASSAIELGAGCGAISMLWARERPEMRICAAELLPEGAALAKTSAAQNGFADRMTVLRRDWRTLDAARCGGPAELVACNPPYFAPGGARAGTPERQLARAEGPGSVHGAAQTAARLLCGRGWFCVIHRTERLCAVIHALHEAGLEPKRLRMIQPDASHAPKLFLAAGRRGARPGLEVLPALLLRNAAGEESAELRQIYGDND